MIPRALPFAAALLLGLVAGLARAQEAIPTDPAAELERVEQAITRIEAAADDAAVAEIRAQPELSGFSLDEKAAWLEALRGRRAALQAWTEGRKLRRALPASGEEARREAEALRTESLAEQERNTSFEAIWTAQWREPAEGDLEAWQTAHENRRNELRPIRERLARARERLAAVREGKPQAELERIRQLGAAFDPESATPLQSLVERTRRIEEARFEERIEQETESRLRAHVQLLEAQHELAMVREQKAAAELATIRRRVAENQDVIAKEKRDEAAELEEQAKGVDSVMRRHVLLRRAEALRHEATGHSKARELHEIETQRGREEDVNERRRGGLERLRERYGDGDRSATDAAESLLSALEHARAARAALRDHDLPRLVDRIRRFERERDEVQDRIWALGAPVVEEPAEWIALREARLEELAGQSEAEVEAAVAGAARTYRGLADWLGRTVDDRLKSIEDALGDLRAIETAYLERIEIYDDTESFVLGRILWLRTADPIGLGTLEGIAREVKEVGAIYTNQGMRSRLAAAYAKGPAAFVLGGLAIVALTAFSVWLVRRLTGFKTGWHYHGGPTVVALQKLGVTLVLSALAPGCLALAAVALELPDLPPEIADPARTLLVGMAIVFFGRRFLNSLLRSDGLARTEFGAKEDVAEQLFRASNRFWAVALLGMLPYVLLTAEPFRSHEIVHLPTAIAVVTLLLLALVIYRLVRPSGALVQALTGGEGFWYQSWVIVSPFVRLGVLAIPVMFAFGYQEGAKLLALNVLQTIVVALVLIGLYNLLTNIVETTARRVRFRQFTEQDQTARERSEQITRQLTRVFGLASVVAAIVFLSGFWGFGDQVGALLDTVRITTVDAETGEALTLKSVLGALLWIAAAHFLIRNLPGIFEATLFTRIKADQGTRFVIQTIAGYIVFVIGYSAAVLSLHIDFQSLAWIFAGASIGIGFGLQEIVSNFVSGLILLIERPIRVGDIIAVGTSEGTVRKINIRSTELLAFDRLVLIIPNRRFISEDVVNWTRNDDVRRLSRFVGIRYSEDIPRALAAVTKALEACPWVLPEPQPSVVVWEFADSSVNLRVLFFVKIATLFRAQGELLAAIHAEFREQEIEIPFPQRDLNVRTVDADAVFRTEHESPPAPPRLDTTDTEEETTTDAAGAGEADGAAGERDD